MHNISVSPRQCSAGAPGSSSDILFEVPGDLALEPFAARPWITRIMVTWGLLSAAVIYSIEAAFTFGCKSIASRPKAASVKPKVSEMS
jgi:hypothetical protein